MLRHFSRPSNNGSCGCLPRSKARLLVLGGTMGTVGRMFSGLRTNQGELVESLKRSGFVQTERVEGVMKTVDRRTFLSEGQASAMEVYQDVPLPIGQGQTISAPHMHATALELLAPYLKENGRALDVGSGSGYLTAFMSLMMGKESHVLGVEKVPSLVNQSKKSLADAASHWELGSIEIMQGNVLSDLLANEEPFHAIHVGAAADEIPDVLIQKMRPGSRMVIPVGTKYSPQFLVTVDKEADGKLHAKRLMEVGYVPLTHPSQDGPMY